MAQYRKKPIVVDAVQWKNGRISEVTDWISEAINKSPNEIGSLFRYGSDIHINTLEGVMVAKDGDYIIKEPFPTTERTIYPCKPGIFEDTYDKVDVKK